MVEGSLFTGNEKDEDPAKKALAEKISWKIFKELDPKLEGSIIRFNQLQVGAGTLNDGDMGTASERLGAIALGCEVSNFNIDARPSVQNFQVGSQPTILPEPGLIEPCYLEDNICVHGNFLTEALKNIAKHVASDDDDDDVDGGNYCDIPIHNNLPGTTRPDLWFFTQGSFTPFNVPSGGQFGIPVEIDGFCPLDPARV